MKEATDHSRVSPEGRAMGEQQARMIRRALSELEREGEPDERCKSCAFREGTVPNGCLQTQMDVLKCVIEGVPFLCHQADRNGAACHGWFAARVALHRAEQARGVKLGVTSCPWDFSPPDEPDAAGVNPSSNDQLGEQHGS
jgi:hypothetical protein